jgi:hypothetical protein
VSADSPLNPSRENRQRLTASPAAARDAQCSSSGRAGWGGVRCKANGAGRKGGLQVAMPWALRTPWLHRRRCATACRPARDRPSSSLILLPCKSQVACHCLRQNLSDVVYRSEVTQKPEHFTVHTAGAQRVYGAVPPAIPRWTDMGQSCGP